MKVSEYYDLDIYSDRGNYIGEVKEIMLDTENGEIEGLVFDKRGEKYTAVPYGSIMAVGDVVIAKSRKERPPETEMEKEDVGTGSPAEEKSEGEE